MKILKRLFMVIFLFGLLPNLTYAQLKLSMELRFGLGFNLYAAYPFKINQRFPGVKVFGSFILVGDINKNIRSNYGSTLTIYTKTLGNDQNPLHGDVQIDFINTLLVGFVSKDTVPYMKYLRTMNNAPYHNLRHNNKYALFVGTNFILNNNKRHQAVGSITATVRDFSLNYYNDGGVPVDLVGIGDGFDRWWTGGLMATVHTHTTDLVGASHSFNRVEASFDQFTGYAPLVYELSNILGINVPEYSSTQVKDSHFNAITPASFNSAAYNLKIYATENYGFDIGVMGSLTSQRHYFGLQDIIHLNGRYPLHPNKDINRITFGLTFNKNGYENNGKN
jgi:hypothetical protein